MSRQVILSLNSGSSSLKLGLYELGDLVETLLADGAAERIGLPDGRLWIRGPGNRKAVDTPRAVADPVAAVEAVCDALTQQPLPPPDAVGHRIVHGGPAHAAPERVTPALLATLRQLEAFAPLHLPSAIRGIEAVSARWPGVPQVACFDTAFHRRMPEIGQRFPLPRWLWDDGVRRYGFHGLSYEYVVESLGAGARGRVIIAHLGNGASLAAVRDGQPVDTTMGLTPTGGCMMGTRSGDLDPGVLLYLMNARGFTVARLQQLVDHESGLLGVSGASADMKTLLELRAQRPEAAQAVELFCYHLRKAIGALAAVLDGVDTLVFTGGIGERAAPVRWEVCAGLGHLGIHIDAERNASHTDPISTSDSACTVRVVETNEDLMIARHTHRVLSKNVPESTAKAPRTPRRKPF